MARFLWLVLANPADGADAEFNRWYDEEHVHDVVGVDTVRSVQRFEFVTTAGTAAPGHRYLAIYEVEADNAEAAIEEMDKARAEAGRMRGTSSLDPDVRLWYFRPIGPLITSP